MTIKFTRAQGLQQPPDRDDNRRLAHARPRGQVLVIVAIGMVVMIAMAGLVIDGGYAWGKQRDTQNAADASAKAGAVKLAENLAGKSPANQDADVEAAVADTAGANVVGLPAAYYTDIAGTMLQSSGAPATGPGDAVLVGDGYIPPGAAGVRAVTDQTFDTFLARVIGFSQFTVTADATAVAGYLETCEASDGCIVLPVTVPVTVLACDGTNGAAPIKPATLWPAPSDLLALPLCSNGPGNVGWLDWTPPSGGDSELVDVILNPTNPYLKWPGWYKITSTGSVSQQVNDAINTYSGQDVLIPQFDLTCDATPSGPGITDCPEDNVGGKGQNQWYHLAGMSTFQLCGPAMSDCVAKGWTLGSYKAGGKGICGSGNGATGCLVGKFVEVLYEGEVQAQPGVNSASSVVGIQLIK